MAADHDVRQNALEDLLEPELALHDYALVELEMLRGGGRITLRVTIERAGGEAIDVEDCAKASRAIARMLDADGDEILPGRYVIEVSSPGIFRPLRRAADYARYVEETVKVVATRSEGSEQVRGRLASADDKGIVIVDDAGERHELTFEDIRKAHLDPDLEIGKSHKKKARH